MVTAEIIEKMKTLSPNDYNLVVMLIERLAEKPSDVLKIARQRYVQENPMTMAEIDDEIQQYRSEKKNDAI